MKTLTKLVAPIGLVALSFSSIASTGESVEPYSYEKNPQGHYSVYGAGGRPCGDYLSRSTEMESIMTRAAINGWVAGYLSRETERRTIEDVDLYKIFSGRLAESCRQDRRKLVAKAVSEVTSEMFSASDSQDYK